MSATIARQGVRVQLENSEISLALNIAKMAKGGFSRTAIEETPYLIKRTGQEVRDEKKWGVKFAGHKEMKAAIDRHSVMLRQNHTAGCLPSHNRTAMNPQTRWRHKGTGVPPPN